MHLLCKLSREQCSFAKLSTEQNLLLSNYNNNKPLFVLLDELFWLVRTYILVPRRFKKHFWQKCQCGAVMLLCPKIVLSLLLIRLNKQI